MLECERPYYLVRDMVRAALKNRDAESYLTNDSISGLDAAVRLLEAYISEERTCDVEYSGVEPRCGRPSVGYVELAGRVIHICKLHFQQRNFPGLELHDGTPNVFGTPQQGTKEL